jgi:hypothetical protein
MKNLLIASFLCLFTQIHAQFEEPKFGKIEMADLQMQSYDKDTSAPALMLFNSGLSYFKLSPSLGFQFTYERHCQIKIFRKSAFDYADFTIRLYENANQKEILSNIKAFTYNLEGGKIVKTKLDNDKVYRKREEKYSEVTFALPDVKEGSIVEVAYTITSDFLYNFRGWNFQYSIPARWSQYTYKIPEYFSYRESSKGYFPFDVNKREKGSVSFQIPGSSTMTTNGFTSKVNQQASQSISALCMNITLGLKDVPAFIPEPNTDCDENYIQSIEFELSSVQMPGQIQKNYTQTWESVNKQMMNDEDFGFLFKADGFVRDTVKLICRNSTTELEKAKAIYDYVRGRMKWNEKYSLWALKGLKKPFEDRTGNSAEINMLLTLMLKAAGLTADPVLYSTRGNGIALSFYPTITKYNSVLSSVKIDGKTYLLDAVNKYCPFGMLPPADINGQGRAINNSGGDWVDLMAPGKYALAKDYVLSIDADGKFSGYITGNYGEYAGMRYRNSMDAEKSFEDYTIKLQENLKGLSINSHAVSGRENNYSPLCDSMIVEITDHSECIGNKILFNPLLFERIEKNSYTLEERKYPVNYNYPYSENYRFVYSIPEGYRVESLPKSRSLKLEDNSVAILYKVENSDGKIVINYQRNISKTVFLPEEYRNLKEIYDLLVKMHAEQVILVKST